jgi:hypothetical protein
VNGDGKADLTGRLLATGDLYVGLSTGTGFACPPLSGGRPWRLAEFIARVTGDGRLTSSATWAHGRPHRRRLRLISTLWLHQRLADRTQA